MPAPTLQAEGGLNVVTTGNNTPTIPTHVAGDILLLVSGFWGPNSVTLGNPLDDIGVSGWTALTSRRDSTNQDGICSFLWRRATAAGTTITVTRPAGGAGPWDTGNDTAWGCRVYVIRGCNTNGDPHDRAIPSTAKTVANAAVDAMTVPGPERLAIHFLVSLDDYVTAPTLSGWTTGTQVESTTGTDHSQASHRKDNVSANTSADASTTGAPAQGFYCFLGCVFRPENRIWRSPYPQLLAH